MPASINVEISGTVSEGLKVLGKDGKSARLVVLDEDGKILAEGPDLTRALWNTTLEVLKNFWIGKGHIRVFSSPPSQHGTDQKLAA
jgi:hypothetical protein